MKKVLVRGPALSQSGYGEHTRFVLRSLRSKPELFDVYLITTNWGATGWLWENNEERTWIDSTLQKTIQYGQSGGQFDISIQVTIPNEWEKVAPINVGITAGIETTKIAPGWVEKSLQMDRIIVVSEHAKYGFDHTEVAATNNQTGEEIMAKVNCPIDIVGYPVKQIEPAEITLELKDDFNFLVMASWCPRKNLENTIKWFVEEFYDQEVGLVVKTSLAKNCLRDREVAHKKLIELLKDYEDRKCNVYLLHGDMSEEEITGLYQHPKIKALVNIAHGEGFGLPIFEAAYNALPVIAPGWGGQCDFLYMPVKDKKGKTKNTPMFTTVSYDIKPIQKEAHWKGVLEAESQWCFPIEWNYKRALREVRKNYPTVQSKANKLQKYVVTEFEESKKYQEMVESILGQEYIEPEDFNGVSFVITTDGSKVEKTKKCIDMIKNQITTKETEILLVGDVKEFGKIERVRMVKAAEVAQKGFLAELRNIGASKAKQDVLVYMDDDMLLTPTWLWRLEEFSKSEGWSVLSNKILNPDGSRMWDRAIMSPHILVPYEHPTTDKNLYQTGGFSVHRKKVFDELQWDGSIPMYAEREGKPNEDIEYSNRLHEAGIVLKFDKENTTWHWDEGYTQVVVDRHNNSQTLRKADILEHQPEAQFPPPCQEFQSLESMIGF